ncbi:MAG: nucleotide exchange factor GrpE [bacterium]|nr:nucleotide exchange factor GrpE [bacterium]
MEDNEKKEPTNGNGAEKDIEGIKEELNKCREEKEENLKGWQRERADFLNYKKEEIKRNDFLKDFVSEEMLFRILAILDEFELAENNASDDIKKNCWFSGFKQIKKQFDDFLKECQVEEIKVEGQKFNPEFHEAVEFTEKEGCAAGEIIETIKKGYTFKEKTLRPARVRVCK